MLNKVNMTNYGSINEEESEQPDATEFKGSKQASEVFQGNNNDDVVAPDPMSMDEHNVTSAEDVSLAELERGGLQRRESVTNCAKLALERTCTVIVPAGVLIGAAVTAFWLILNNS